MGITLAIEKLSKTFGEETAIEEVSFQAESGELFALLGPSGAGKSTTLNCIAGLVEPDSGDIRADGESVLEIKPQFRDFSMVFESYALYPHLTVAENMAFPLKAPVRSEELSEEQLKKRVQETAQMLEIPELLERYPKELSGGQRQRVAMGRAIVRKPKVFLFDEPLSNLDAILRVAMRVELAKLHERLKTTIIYVTHDQIEAMTLADRIIIMDNGLIRQIGPPLEVYDDPQDLFVAGFIGSPAMNFLDASVTKKMTLKSNLFELGTTDRTKKIIKNNNLIGKDVVIGIRPEDLEDSSFVQDNLSKDNTITANVEVTEPMGAEIYIYIDIEGVLVTARVDSRTKIKSGSKATLFIYIDKLHIFDKETEQTYT